ncbi:MAG TPA: hypothetical protein VFW11_11430 [Cyclobacteriaceae bacterium]|nr:hypothetical protein [Cyclobacteriaceae bacterium]
METASKKAGKLAKNIGLLGIGLCALCCALPVVDMVGGVGILATAALYAEKIAVVLLITSAAFAIWQYQKRQPPPACSIDCHCKTENEETKSITELRTK